MKGRLKVLVLAYACAPGYGSEPGVGWNFAREMAIHHDVWILTRTANRKPIHDALVESGVPGLHVEYFDLPGATTLWKNGRRARQLYYYLWQLASYWVIRRLQRTVGFDVAQHVSFMRYWSPSALAFHDVPYVWGPVGGGESTPRSHQRSLSRSGQWKELIREMARTVGEMDPLVRLTARRARIALASTEESAARMSRLGASDTRLFDGCALTATEVSRLRALPISSTSYPLVFLSVGRLLAWKGFHLGLEAFARASIPGASYWILGDGPERKKLEALADSLGVSPKVRFLGEVSRDEVFEALGTCAALVHPSLHDSGGFVCLESMAAGKPVICLNLGGPAVQVTEETGVKVPAGPPTDTIRMLANAMSELAKDERLRRSLGEGGRRRISEAFTWDRKIAATLRLYREITDTNACRVEI